MKAILRALKPTPLAIVLMMVALLLQAVFFSTLTATYSPSSADPARSTVAFGLGSPISLTTEAGETSYGVRWEILALNLATMYTLAVLAAAGIVATTRLRRPASAFGMVAAVMVAVAFVVSMGISKAYWGYFLARPAPLSEVGDVVTVQAIASFKSASTDAGQRTIVPDSEYSVSQHIESGRRDSYYCLTARILLELERRNLLLAVPTATLAGLPELYPLIQTTGMLASSKSGYESANGLRGVVVDAIDKMGDRLIFLVLTGGQVSNDHYPYYELLFRGRSDASTLSFARGQRFFYDVAGVEGLEWYGIYVLLVLPAIAGGFVVLTLTMMIRKRRSPRACVPVLRR